MDQKEIHNVTHKKEFSLLSAGRQRLHPVPKCTPLNNGATFNNTSVLESTVVDNG